MFAEDSDNVIHISHNNGINNIYLAVHRLLYILLLSKLLVCCYLITKPVFVLKICYDRSLDLNRGFQIVCN